MLQSIHMLQARVDAMSQGNQLSQPGGERPGQGGQNLEVTTAAQMPQAPITEPLVQAQLPQGPTPSSLQAPEARSPAGGPDASTCPS